VIFCFEAQFKEFMKFEVQARSQLWQSIGMLVLLTAIWGSTFPIIQVSLDSISAPSLLFFRFLIAAIVMLFIAFSTNNFRLKTKTSGFVCGMLLFVGFLFQTYGLKYTTPTRAAFITGLCTVLVPVFDFFIFKRNTNQKIWIGIVITFFGLSLLTLSHTAAGTTASSVFLGDFLTFICSILFALHILFMGHYSKIENLVALATWQIVYVVPLAFLFYFFESNNPIEAISKQSWIALVYLALIATAFATLAQLWAQKKVSASFAALIIALEPAFAAFFSNVFLGEKLSFFGGLGCVVMLLGCMGTAVATATSHK
jgi:drug/metabolite transporter (DMT)-like permease